MSLIIDANVAGQIFNQDRDSVDYPKLQEEIFANRHTLYHGGKLSKEYEDVKLLVKLSELSKSGRAIKVSSALIDKEETFAKKNCLSDDWHIIALARAEPKARVLVSKDEALRQDFKNKYLINNPRGKIYSSTRHQQSLRIP